MFILPIFKIIFQHLVSIGITDNLLCFIRESSPKALIFFIFSRVTGILTVGTGSLTLDGPNNLVNVGTALTLGHTQGVQFHTQNLHSAGFEVNQINATGVITATSFSGSGANLTGLASREVYGFTGIGNSLSLTTTNNGADDIDNATYVAFEESFIGPSGLSFSINTSGNLIMTV